MAIDLDSISATRLLASVWKIVSEATKRSLTVPEKNELQKLCNSLGAGMPGRDDFNASVDSFCIMMSSCGLFVTGNSKAAEELLLDIDAARGMIA